MARLMILIAAFAMATAVTAGDEPPEQTFDGLKRLEDSKLALVYVKPGADFSIYQRMMLTPAQVAFRKGWRRSQNSSRTGVRRISQSNVTRIKKRLAELFREVFVNELEGKGGYQVVDTAAEDVLLIRASIIELDITAPDVKSATPSRTFVTSAGSAILYIELFDSLSGEILARAVDRTKRMDSPHFQYSTSVSNSAEARRALQRWASVLRKRLDEVHAKTQAKKPKR